MRPLQAELFALNEGLNGAIQWLNDNAYDLLNPTRLTAFTDCRSLLQRLERLTLYPKRVNPLWISLLQRTKLLRDMGCSVCFTWIPGHSGIKLNEIADKLAKNGLLGDPYPTILPTTNQKVYSMLRYRRNCEFQAWLKANITQSGWEHAPPRDIFRSAKPNTRLSRSTGPARKVQIQLFRIRTGHTRLRQHRHRFKMDDEENCRLCESKPETAMHLFLECKKLKTPLKELRQIVGELPDLQDDRYKMFHGLLNRKPATLPISKAILTLNEREIYF